MNLPVISDIAMDFLLISLMIIITGGNQTFSADTIIAEFGLS